MNQDQEISLSDLPLDTLGLIRQYVSPSLMNFVDDVKCKFFHPIFEDIYYKDFPQLRDARVCSSNFGWLLMNEGHSCLFFFNPFTLQRIDVPNSYDRHFDIFYFSSPPTSSSCTVIATKTITRYTYIGVIKRGEAKWKITEFPHDCKFTPSFCNPVFLDDHCYFMADQGNIGIYDVKANTWEICDKPIVPHRKRYLYCPIAMVENHKGMMVIYETREHEKLCVARFDLSKKIWEQVDCLGDDKVLYVSRWASYLETIAAEGMGNKIYFPKFHRGNGVFYSFATKKYHSYDGSYCSESPYGLTQHRFSFWIKPTSCEAKVEGWFDNKKIYL